MKLFKKAKDDKKDKKDQKDNKDKANELQKEKAQTLRPATTDSHMQPGMPQLEKRLSTVDLHPPQNMDISELNKQFEVLLVRV